MTSYSAGGLFRWRYNGGRPNQDVEAELKARGDGGKAWRDRRLEDKLRYTTYVSQFFPQYNIE